MQTGYVMCSADLNKVLCLNQDKSSVTLVEVESTQDLNRSICLWDLTETKNIYERFENQGLISDLKIVNVARLYKKFY
mgnify:CR=1 FL=1|jgi:hypothetical protein